MVGGAVFAHQSGPIETEHDGQLEYGHIVDDIIISPLCEGTIDIAEGQQPVLGHAGGEGDGVSLGDAHVEHAVGHLCHRYIHRAPGRHGRRNADDTWVLSGQFEQCVSKDVLELRRLVLVVAMNEFAGIRVELTGSVPHGLVVLGGGIAVAFLGMEMEQFGPLHVLQLPEDAYQLLHIVAVEGSEVADVHPLEDVLLLGDGTLQGVRQTDDAFLPVFGEQSLLGQPP